KKSQEHNPNSDTEQKSESFHIEVIDDILIDLYKQKSPLERLQIAFGLWKSASTQLFYNLRSLYPDWDEKKIRQEIAKRISHGAA
ncbi:MAG: hypothetical protein PVH84_14635, partial [Candidatus Aminicenantes bacterium]